MIHERRAIFFVVTLRLFFILASTVRVTSITMRQKNFSIKQKDVFNNLYIFVACFS